MAKYIAAYVSGAVAVLLPLALSFALCATKYPCAELYQRAQRSVIMDRNMFSQFYYTAPWIYMLIYWFVNMLAGGCLPERRCYFPSLSIRGCQWYLSHLSCIPIWRIFWRPGTVRKVFFEKCDQHVRRCHHGDSRVHSGHVCERNSGHFLVYYVVGITKERIH